MKSKLMVCFLLFGICCNGQTKMVTIHVEPYMRLSYGAFYKSLTIKSDNSAVDYIQGFNFEWGYAYKLKIEETKLKAPPEDGSDTNHKLIKVLSKTRVADTTQFSLSLQRNVYLGPGEQESSFNKLNDSTYRYFDKIDMIVPDYLKNDFNKIIENGIDRKGIFVFTNDRRIKLIKLN